MAGTEKEEVTKGVSGEGLPKRDYSITVPKKGLSPDLDQASLEVAVNVENDLPINAVPDTPKVPIKVISDESKKALAVEEAAIIEKLQDLPYAPALEYALQSIDPKTSLREAAGALADMRVSKLEEQFTVGEYSSAEAMRAAANAVIDAEKVTEEERSNPHLAYVRSIESVHGEDAARMANQLEVLEMARDIWDNMDLVDKGWAFAGLLAPFNISKDNTDISGNPFGGEEFVRNLIINYKRSSPEQQARMLPVLKDQLFKDLDNELKVMEVLNAMGTPGGEANLDSFSSVWAGAELLGGAVTAANIARRIAQIQKGLNAAKTAQRLGNEERAAQLTADSVINPETAAAVGVDRVEAANLASPFNLSGIDAAYIEGLSTESVNNVNKFVKKMDEVDDQLKGNDLFLREGLLDKIDRTLQENKYLKHIETEDAVEDVRVASRTGNTTTFKYKQGGDEVESTLQLELDQTGVWQNKITTIVDDILFSPTVTFNKGEMKELVAAAQRQDSAQAVVFNTLMQLQREATKTILGPLGLKGLTPSGRRRLNEVNHIIQLGDQRKEVYKFEELKAGVDGIQLDDKQASAYFKLRRLGETSWDLTNHEERIKKQIHGLKHIHVSEDLSAFGKPFDDFPSAVASLNKTGHGVKEIFDVAAKRGVTLSNDKLEEAYESGKVLVRMEEANTFETSATKWNYALIERTDIGELPAHVIPYRVGQSPKFNKNINYLVKEFKPATVDGVKIKAGDPGGEISTLRGFDNKADALKFEAEVKAAGKESGSQSMFRMVADRQLETEARGLFADSSSVSTGHNKMGTGARKSTELLFGLEGVPAERLGAFESMSRSIANLSRLIPRNEWRLGIQQKAVNTANDILPPQHRIEHFDDIKKLGDSPEGLYLKKLHKQIEDWLGFPTKSEQMWENAVQASYDWLTAKGFVRPGSMTGRSIQWLKHTDPVSNARSAAFHSLLGWFNPIQLWVQAQGAAVAVSRNIFNPAEMATVIRDVTALAASRHAQNPETFKHIAKAFGVKADELQEMQRLWKKSGLEDSMLMTADHAAAAEGRSIAMDAMSRAADKGLLFYRMGELFNRRTSFITSYREWIKANPGKKIDDNALKSIMERTNNFMLNLGRANRAGFQKGPIGITTQFLHVGTHTIETLFGLNKNLSVAERGKLLTTQVLLYGSAGIGINSIGGRAATSLMGYDKQYDIDDVMSPETRKLINEGLEGLITLQMFGVDIDVGQRSSLLGSVTDFVDRMLFDDTTFVEAVGGAFGSSSTRFWKALTQTLRPVMYGEARVRDIDPLITVRRFMKTISSWNNFEKGLLMNKLHKIQTSSGKILRKRDFTLMEELAVGMGFKLSEEVQIYDLKAQLKAEAEFKSKIADLIVEHHNEFALLSSEGDITPEDNERISDNIATLYQIFEGGEQMDLRDTVQSRLSSEDEFTRMWLRFRKEFVDGRKGDLHSMHSTISNYGVMQEIKSEEE